MTALESAAPPDAPAGSGATFRRWRGLEDIPGMAAANARLRGSPRAARADRRRRHAPPLHAPRELGSGDRLHPRRARRGRPRVRPGGVARPGRWRPGLRPDLGPRALGLGPRAHGGDDRLGRGPCREIALEHPTDRRSHLANYVFGGDTELATALETLGYTAVRWDAEMLRPDMEDLPAVVVPEGYVLRAPEPGELPAVHEMAVSAFSEHWGEWEGADHELEEWIEDPRFRRDLVVVAFHGSQPVTALSNSVETLLDGSVRGMLETLATHPDHRRRGLGRAAMARSLELLRAAGRHDRLPRRGHGQRQPGTGPLRVLWLRRRLHQHLVPQAHAGHGGPPMTTIDAALPLAPAASGLRFRRWQGVEDIAGMAAANATLRRRVGVLEPIDVEVMRHRYTHLVNSDPATDCILAERNGITLGYARIEWHDLTDGDRTFDVIAIVDPAAWGLGVAEAFMRWGEVRAHQLAREHPSDRTHASHQLRVPGRRRSHDGPRGAGLRRGPLGRRDAAARHGRHPGRRAGRRVPPPRPGGGRAAGRPPDDGRGVRRALGRARGGGPAHRGLARGSPVPPRPRGRGLGRRSAGVRRVQHRRDGTRTALAGGCSTPS